MFEEVCRTLRQRLDENLPITPVSFNLSRYDFDMMDVFAFIENTRRKYAVPRDFLHIEITESVLAQDSRVIQQALTNLRQEGYEIWLDDFGSGYSSLNILKDYTVDLIKLDMGFLRSFTEKSRSIISSVIGMAKELGIKTLAEGVETQEHVDFLASIGCGCQQGFFYGKPRPLAGTLAHIEEERRGIELRKWCHYYDVASMVIRQTDRTSALFDALENGRLRFLYTNRAYREQLQALGYRLQDVEENLSIKGKSEVYDLFWEVVNRSRQSHKEEAFYYIDSGNYINARLRVVYAMNRHLLIHIEFQNISKSIEGMQQGKLDDNLRYLYSIFEHVCIVDFQQDTIDQLYVQGGILGNDGKPGVTHDIRKALQEVAQEFVYEEDRAHYLAFCDPETVVERIRKSPYGRISCRFRVRDRQGKYEWRECIAILLESRFDEHIQDSYDSSFRVLVREEAGILRRHTGKDAAISRIQNATFAILRRETSHKESEKLARELQYRLQSIHEIEGNAVTITYGYSIVHSDDPAIHRLPDASVSYIYRLALERLRHKD